MASKRLAKASEELGLVSLRSSTIDVKLLCSQRFLRLFAYGGSTLILVSYLQELGTSKENIGLFMTLTLVGDTAISFVLTLFANTLGRKSILVLGAILMAASGVMFALFGNYGSFYWRLSLRLSVLVETKSDLLEPSKNLRSLNSLPLPIEVIYMRDIL